MNSRKRELCFDGGRGWFRDTAEEMGAMLYWQFWSLDLTAQFLSPLGSPAVVLEPAQTDLWQPVLLLSNSRFICITLVACIWSW